MIERGGWWRWVSLVGGVASLVQSVLLVLVIMDLREMKRQRPKDEAAQEAAREAAREADFAWFTRRCNVLSDCVSGLRKDLQHLEATTERRYGGVR